MFLFEHAFSDSLLPLVTLGVSVGQLEFEFEFRGYYYYYTEFNVPYVIHK